MYSGAAPPKDLAGRILTALKAASVEIENVFVVVEVGRVKVRACFSKGRECEFAMEERALLDLAVEAAGPAAGEPFGEGFGHLVSSYADTVREKAGEILADRATTVITGIWELEPEFKLGRKA